MQSVSIISSATISNNFSRPKQLETHSSHRAQENRSKHLYNLIRHWDNIFQTSLDFSTEIFQISPGQTYHTSSELQHKPLFLQQILHNIKQITKLLTKKGRKKKKVNLLNKQLNIKRFSLTLSTDLVTPQQQNCC